MLENVAACLSQMTRGIVGKSLLGVSMWADLNRVMPTSGAVAGKWDTKKTPYLREIMDCLSEDNPARVVVLEKGTQIGGSEVGYNFIGYVIGECPGNIILALPTADLYREVSRQRIAPMIELSPAIRERMIDSKEMRATIRSKGFHGGNLVAISAKSAPSLRLINARYLVLDEVDGYPLTISGEGDPVALLFKRTSTFAWQSKILITSTPLLEESSRVHAYLEQTDKSYFFIPCPFCAHMHKLEWANMKWEKGDSSSARMACPKCKKQYTEDYKDDFLPAGKWQASKKADNIGWRGFHLSALYSPYGWFPWTQAVAEYEMSEMDEHKRQAFSNTVLALPFKHYAYRPNITAKTANQKAYGVEGVHAPKEVMCLTVGVDVQYKRVEIYVYGWAQGEVAYAIDYLNIKGDLSRTDFWAQLHQVLGSLEYKTADGRMLRPAAMAIDTGGRHTVEVYRFVLGVHKDGYKNMFAVKGVPGYDRPIIKASSRQITKKVLDRSVDLWQIGVDTCKSVIYKKISDKELHSPIAWACGNAVENEYYKQLVAEARELKYVHGFAKHYWVKVRDRNEALDCAVYAYAALKGLKVDWTRLIRNEKKRGGKVVVESGNNTPAKAIKKRGVIIIPND